MKSILNMNDSIYVELLPEAWDYLRKYHEDLFSRYGEIGKKFFTDTMNCWKRRTHKYLVDGEWKELTKIQMHEFMEMFGSTVQFGQLNRMFCNDLYLSVDESTKQPNELDVKEANQ